MKQWKQSEVELNLARQLYAAPIQLHQEGGSLSIHCSTAEYGCEETLVKLNKWKAKQEELVRLAEKLDLEAKGALFDLQRLWRQHQ